MTQLALARPAPSLPPVPALLAPEAAPPLLPGPSIEGEPSLILYGRDERGRPHASRFVGVDRGAVAEAARLMRYHLALAETAPLRALSAQLPAGRVFAGSGKGFVPFCSAKLYQQLLAATGTPEATMPVKAAGKPGEAGSAAGTGQGSGAGGGGAGGPAGKGGPAMPIDWTGIKIGSVVLAQGDDEEGYYAARVVATKADDAVQLVWCGFDLPEFARPRRALGLLHPEAAGTVA